MAGDLPLIEFLPLLTTIVTIVITVFVFYKYFNFEKKRSDLIIGIAFLFFTLGILVATINFVTNPAFFPDNGLGGLDQWLTFIGFLVFLIVIEPMEVINHFMQGRSGDK